MCCERKDGLIEDNMARGDNLARRDVEAAIALVRAWVAKEHAGDRAGRELVGSSGRYVRIAQITKNPKICVGRLFVEGGGVVYGG